MPHKCVPCTSTLQISVLELEKQFFWVILSTSLSTCVREQDQCQLFSPCFSAAQPTPSLPPSSLRAPSPSSQLQEGAMSLCPGQGHQLLPAEGLFASCWIYSHLLMCSGFPRLQWCPSSQFHVPWECHQGCFYLFSEPGWQVGCPGCPSSSWESLQVTFLPIQQATTPFPNPQDNSLLLQPLWGQA